MNADHEMLSRPGEETFGACERRIWGWRLLARQPSFIEKRQVSPAYPSETDCLTQLPAKLRISSAATWLRDTLEKLPACPNS